jgi:hypothetical protein
MPRQAAEQDSGIGPVFFYTRFGLGVADERWTDFRLALFKAVTMPSVARFCAEGASWVIFVDTWLRPHHDRELREAIASQPGAERIRVEPVDFMVQMRARMAELTAEHETVTLVRIDDDDALADDFLDLVPAGQGLFTLPRGYEVVLADGVLREMRHPFHSMNAILTAPHALVREYVRVSHSDTRRWAEQQGLRVQVVEDATPAYLYVRQELADTGYRVHRENVLADTSHRELTPELVRRFGVDVNELQRWRELASGYPALSETKTWNHSHGLNREALPLLDELEQVHRRIWDATSDLLADPTGET